jgi:hypothetical protein
LLHSPVHRRFHFWINNVHAHLNSVQHTARYVTAMATVHRSGISISSPSQANSEKKSLCSIVHATIEQDTPSLACTGQANNNLH